MKKNKKSYQLAASLVCADMLDLGGEVKKLEKGGIDQIHFDVMDGDFVPRLGLHPEILEAVKSITKLPINVHLMISNPEIFIRAFAEAGADIIIVHAESTNHLHRMIKLIQGTGVKAGVALNPATPLNVLDYVLDDIDLVLLMAINPGIVGHKLIPKAMDKIADLKEKTKNYPNMIIEIDGGVTPESSAEMIKKGANMLVCGSSTIFKKGQDVAVKIGELRKVIDKEING